jgi:hypothetical protein
VLKELPVLKDRLAHRELQALKAFKDLLEPLV